MGLGSCFGFCESLNFDLSLYRLSDDLSLDKFTLNFDLFYTLVWVWVLVLEGLVAGISGSQLGRWHHG